MCIVLYFTATLITYARCHQLVVLLEFHVLNLLLQIISIPFCVADFIRKRVDYVLEVVPGIAQPEAV